MLQLLVNIVITVVELRVILFMHRNFMDDLVKVAGIPALLQKSFQKAYHSAESILLKIQILISKFPQIPQNNGNPLTPLDHFFQMELELMHQVLDRISADTVELLMIAKGQMAQTFNTHQMLLEIGHQRVPQMWSATKFLPDISVIKWINLLGKQSKLLLSYIPIDSRPSIFHMGAFNRPDQFLQVVLLHSAQQLYKRIHTGALDVRVRA